MFKRGYCGNSSRYTKRVYTIPEIKRYLVNLKRSNYPADRKRLAEFEKILAKN